MEMISAKRLILVAVFVLLLPLALLLLPRPQPQPPTKAPPGPAPAVPSVTKPPPGSRNPWQLTEAREALQRQPDDGYLQFIVLQLARQEGRLGAVVDDIPQFAARRAAKPIELFGYC
jgi:hypothetical protein